MNRWKRSGRGSFVREQVCSWITRYFEYSKGDIFSQLYKWKVWRYGLIDVCILTLVIWIIRKYLTTAKNIEVLEKRKEEAVEEPKKSNRGWTREDWCMFSKEEWTCRSQEEQRRCSKGSSERTRDTQRTSWRRDSLLRYSRQVWRLVEDEGVVTVHKWTGWSSQKRRRRQKTMTTEGHCRGLEKIHSRRKKKERPEEFNREFLELVRDIVCFEKHMQAVEEEN